MKLKQIVPLLLVAALAVGCTRISPGYAGIKVVQGGADRGVQDYPSTTGWVFYNPLTSTVMEYPTFVQTATLKDAESISFQTKDKMNVTVAVSASYNISAAKVPHFYVQFRNDDIDLFTHGYLRNEIKNAFTRVGGRHSIDDVMGNSQPLLDEVRKDLEEHLSPIGVLVGQLGFIGTPQPPESVLQSINATAQAVQMAIQKKNELAATQAEAEKVVAKESGEARARIIRAESEAEANRKLAASLSRELIEYQQIWKWDGKLPTMVGGSGAVPFINVK